MLQKGAILYKNHREYLCHFGGRPVQLKKKKKKKMNKKIQKFGLANFRK